MSEPAIVQHSLITCHNCGREVPDGDFCGACGAHLAPDVPAAGHRPFAFAAAPNEHVFHFNVVSTCFPHLPHRRGVPFRIALLVTAAILIALGMARLTGPAVAVAAIAVPLLYLLYLYEVEVYEDEPVLVIALTLGVGLVLGALWAHFTGPYITHTLLLNSARGLDSGRGFTAAVLLPLASQLLMLVGASAIYFLRPRYDEALDGFSFGAASALGFTLAATLVNLWPDLSQGVVSSAPALNNTLVILERGLLIPFINAGLTGLIAGSFWLHRGPYRRLPFHRWTISIPAALVVVAAVRIGLGYVNVYVASTAWTAFIYLAVSAALLIWVRINLHYLLLSEAVEMTIGPDTPCPHCHHIVPRMAFCPHCGVATRSTPKIGVGRLLREVR